MECLAPKKPPYLGQTVYRRNGKKTDWDSRKRSQKERMEGPPTPVLGCTPTSLPLISFSSFTLNAR